MGVRCGTLEKVAGMTTHVWGAGLAGLSFLHHAAFAAEVWEQQPEIGGTVRPHRFSGATFDHGPHISFTKNEDVRHLFQAAVQGEVIDRPVRTANWLDGQWVEHPVLTHLAQVEPRTARKILADYLQALMQSKPDPRDYADWCRQNQGEYFADQFTRRYTRKFWTVEPEELTWQWAGARVSHPALDTVLDGLFGIPGHSGYYISTFRYPRVGGYGQFAGFHPSQDERIHRGWTVVALDEENRWFEVAHTDGSIRRIAYTRVASSLPLPELVRVAQHVPPIVKDAAARLRATSELFVNVVFPGAPLVPYDWIYVYDESILFPRATYMNAIAPSNAPAGMTALQLEVPFSPSRPLPETPEVIADRVIEQARGLGLIPRTAAVTADWMVLPYAYVIYDHARAEAVQTVKAYFESRAIHPFGRYGNWAYLWSDQAVLSGKHLASQLGRPN